jgi:hypothetical protein
MMAKACLSRVVALWAVSRVTQTWPGTRDVAT